MAYKLSYLHLWFSNYCSTLTLATTTDEIANLSTQATNTDATLPLQDLSIRTPLSAILYKRTSLTPACPKSSVRPYYLPTSTQACFLACKIDSLPSW